MFSAAGEIQDLSCALPEREMRCSYLPAHGEVQRQCDGLGDPWRSLFRDAVGEHPWSNFRK